MKQRKQYYGQLNKSNNKLFNMYRVKQTEANVFIPQKFYFWFLEWQGISKDEDFLFSLFQETMCGQPTLEDAKIRISEYKLKTRPVKSNKPIFHKAD